MKKVILLASFVFLFTTLTIAQKKERVQIDADQNFLVLSTKKISTMEKELDEVAAKGFRVQYAAPSEDFDMALFLKRDEESIKNPATYRILATSRVKTMRKELNEFSEAGYRFMPRTAIFKKGFVTAEFVTIMEKLPFPTMRYVYKLIRGRKETKVHKEIELAMTDGFKPISMIILGRHVVVMEKAIPLER